MENRQELIKEIYLEWMIEIILKKPACCIELLEYIGMKTSGIQELYPDMVYYKVESLSGKTEIDTAEKIIRLSVEEFPISKEQIAFKFPGFIGGIPEEDKYVVFSFNEAEVVIDAFFILTKDFESTFSERLYKKINSLFVRMITEDVTYADIENIPDKLFLN